MSATTYGLDVAKRVFQMYWVDADTGEIGLAPVFPDTAYAECSA